MQSSEDSVLSLRVRRQKTTYFLSCGPFESIDSLKRKLLIFHKGFEFSDIRLYQGNKVLLQSSSCQTINPIYMTRVSSTTPSCTTNSKKETLDNGRIFQSLEFDQDRINLKYMAQLKKQSKQPVNWHLIKPRQIIEEVLNEPLIWHTMIWDV